MYTTFFSDLETKTKFCMHMTYRYRYEMMSCMSHDFVPRNRAMILIHLAFLTSELKLFRSKRILCCLVAGFGHVSFVKQVRVIPST